MSTIESIELKQAEIKQKYSELESTRDSSNAEMIRLQGEFKAYKEIMDIILKETQDATSTTDTGSRQRNTSK